MQVVIQKIPENLSEFEMLTAEGRQPERICALFLCALALFDRDKNAAADMRILYDSEENVIKDTDAIYHKQ